MPFSHVGIRGMRCTVVDKKSYFCSMKHKYIHKMKNYLRNAYIYIMCIAGLAGLSACKEKPQTADEIYQKDASGVVLIVNRFYYTMRYLGSTVYFTGIDEEGNLENISETAAEATQNAATAFGTGFFISRDGNIMTNRHVVRPEIDQDQIKSVLFKYVQNVKHYFAELRDKAEEEYNELYYNCIINGSDANYYEVNQRLAELKDAYEEYDSKVSEIENVSLEELNNVIVTPSCRISIVYNGANCSPSGVIPSNEMHDCTITKVSGIDDVDLAVIQLNNKKTPKDKYIFHFASGTKGKRTLLETYWQRARRDYKGRKLKPGTQLCMIGFNHGPELAQTTAGLKAQIATGNILQEPDYRRLMYTIPILEGSSGSPVLNMYGDVVGVNFAKLKGTTSFNFGIPLARVKEFLGIDN